MGNAFLATTLHYEALAICALVLALGLAVMAIAALALWSIAFDKMLKEFCLTWALGEYVVHRAWLRRMVTGGAGEAPTTCFVCGAGEPVYPREPAPEVNREA